MEQTNYITEREKGKHLNYDERIKIEALHKAKISKKEIATLIGCHERSIRRELKRGEVTLLTSELVEYATYSAEKGQAIYDKNATGKGPQLKIGKDYELVKYIEKSIKKRISPYATLQNIENDDTLNFTTKITVKTLYNYIDMNLFMNISNKDLLVKKDGKKRNYKKVRVAYNNTKGTSISERPEEISTRKEYGHWEIDSVVYNGTQIPNHA